MKKIILLFFMFLLSACHNLPSGEVNSYLNDYKDLSNNINDQINMIIEESAFKEETSSLYRKVYERQYQDMKYTINSYKCLKNNCDVPVTIEVYDYITVQNDALEYLINNENEFIDEDGYYDVNKYEEYKLNSMLNTNKRIKYDINFHLEKHLTSWIITSIDNVDLLKIHGIYE